MKQNRKRIACRWHFGIRQTNTRTIYIVTDTQSQRHEQSKQRTEECVRETGRDRQSEREKAHIHMHASM